MPKNAYYSHKKDLPTSND